jgi:hypothetical protein
LGYAAQTSGQHAAKLAVLSLPAVCGFDLFDAVVLTLMEWLVPLAQRLLP